MADYNNSLKRLTNTAANYLIGLSDRDPDETISVGNIVGGLMSPVGVLEEKADEEETNNRPLSIQNAAVNNIHGAVANNIKVEEPEYYNYTIRSGDTLSRIASDSGVDMADIVKINDIADPNKIRAGAMLRIPTSNVEMFESATGIKFPQAPKKEDVTITSPISKGFVTPIDLQDDDTKIANKIKFYAEKYDMPLDFVSAIAGTESNFTNVIGDKTLKNKAYGIFQVRLPALQDVQRYYGLDYTEDDLKNMDLNATIESGIAYMAMLRDNYGAKSLTEIAAMYNGGPSAVKNKNQGALKYASKVMDIRYRTMEEFNRMIKVTELDDSMFDRDEIMFEPVSGGVPKLDEEGRDDLLDASLGLMQTSTSPLGIAPFLSTGEIQQDNMYADLNIILNDDDLPDSQKISLLKANINRLTPQDSDFNPEATSRFKLGNPFMSPAEAATLDPSVIEKPVQLVSPEKIKELKVRYYTDADDEDIIKVAEPNSTWRDILNAIPPNVRVFVNDVFKNVGGGTPSFNETFTEENLSTEYIDLLKDIVKSVATTKEGSSAQIIEYDDYKSSEGKYDDVKWNTKGLPDLKNKRFNLKTTFGQAVILLDDNENIIVKDRFNFNDGVDVDSIHQAVAALKNIGGAVARGQFYGGLRKYGKYFGSKEGEGQYISINLGNAKELLGETFDLSKLRLTEEAQDLQRIAQGIDVNRGLMTRLDTSKIPNRPTIQGN